MLEITRPIILAASFALALSSCGTSGEPPETDVGNNGSTMSEVGNNGGASNGDTPDMSEAEMGEFQLGTNPVSEATPDGFMPMSDGSEVPIVWGVQGSWMVVLAFRTEGVVDGLFDIRASMTIDGVESGEVWLEQQETFPGGDGSDYYYSLFLALDIDGDPPPRGTPAHIAVSVTDENGTMVEKEHDVAIGRTVGGPGE